MGKSPDKGRMNGKCKCTNPACDVEVSYTEGQIVGYRWYDKMKVAPAFPFGHGLTYGSFSYSGLSVNSTTVSFTVEKEQGSHPAACDTPQVYFGFPGAAADKKKPQ